LGQTESGAERTSAVAVERGLYIVRYVSAEDPVHPPMAEICQSAGPEGAIEIISAPGIPFGKLSRPGSCLVVRAEQSGELLIALRSNARSSSLEASFRLESLTSREELESWQSVLAEDLTTTPSLPTVRRGVGLQTSQAGGPSARVEISLLAHVAVRGDLTVKGEEWVAGPDAPAPIEGLEIQSVSQPGLNIEVQVLIAGRPPRWSEWAKLGVFAGTRGRGLPLVGVRLRLQGGNTEEMELVADALFLGSLVKSKRGREIEFASASGSDPLVGFKLALRALEKVAAPPISVVGNRDRGPRVRVFRASSAGRA